MWMNGPGAAIEEADSQHVYILPFRKPLVTDIKI